MRSKLSPRCSVVLASLLLLLGGSFRPSHAAVPMFTILNLRVNGFITSCGALVQSGDTVCLRFQSDQSGFAQVSIKKDAGSYQLIAQGSVSGGVTYAVCVTAGTADNITRTFKVTVTNSTTGTGTGTCDYTVMGSMPSTAPTLMTSLTVNGTASTTACPGTTIVSPGDTVCLLFKSDQNGFAQVFTKKGTSGSQVLRAQGSVTAGVTYSFCVTAGAADGDTRTFTVTVTNGSNLSTSAMCSYKPM
jgi:hypothetical protein